MSKHWQVLIFVSVIIITDTDTRNTTLNSTQTLYIFNTCELVRCSSKPLSHFVTYDLVFWELHRICPDYPDDRIMPIEYIIETYIWLCLSILRIFWCFETGLCLNTLQYDIHLIVLSIFENWSKYCDIFIANSVYFLHKKRNTNILKHCSVGHSMMQLGARYIKLIKS